MEVDIPDLTQQIQFINEVPIFSGTYSTVQKGILHGEVVRNDLLSLHIKFTDN